MATAVPTTVQLKVTALRPRSQWLLLTLLVVAGVALLAIEDVATTARMIEVVPPMQQMELGWRSMVMSWGPWLLLAPGIAFLGWRFVPGRVRWWSALLIHALAAGVAPWVVSELQGLLGAMILGEEFATPWWSAELTDSVEILSMPANGEPQSVVLGESASVFGFADSAFWWFYLHELSRFVGLTAVAVVPSLTLLSGERERLRDQVARELAETETRMLRGQLQPHFLFNALNGIQVLIDEDPERSKIFLRRLSDLLRNTLEDAHLAVLPLARELEILDDYLEIERLRFGERMRFEVEVEPGLERVPVLSFLIQPLIENSLVHGPGSVPGIGRICVRIARQADGLQVVVSDDGPGANRPGDQSATEPGRLLRGRGLGVLEKRLARHFADRASLAIESPRSGGFSVTVRFPIGEKGVVDDTSPRS